MSESLSLVISPTYIGGILGLALFNASMAIFQNFLISLVVLLVVVIVFPFIYVDRAPRCVYCFSPISAGAQFCAACGRVQP